MKNKYRIKMKLEILMEVAEDLCTDLHIMYYIYNCLNKNIIIILIEIVIMVIIKNVNPYVVI